MLYTCTVAAQVSVISLGPKGCIARAKDGSRGASDAAKVKVVDTIGAGDCFTAGFLYAYLHVSAGTVSVYLLPSCSFPRLPFCIAFMDALQQFA